MPQEPVLACFLFNFSFHNLRVETNFFKKTKLWKQYARLGQTHNTLHSVEDKTVSLIMECTSWIVIKNMFDPVRRRVLLDVEEEYLWPLYSLSFLSLSLT